MKKLIHLSHCFFSHSKRNFYPLTKELHARTLGRFPVPTKPSAILCERVHVQLVPDSGRSHAKTREKTAAPFLIELTAQWEKLTSDLQINMELHSLPSKTVAAVIIQIRPLIVWDFRGRLSWKKKMFLVHLKNSSKTRVGSAGP